MMNILYGMLGVILALLCFDGGMITILLITKNKSDKKSSKLPELTEDEIQERDELIKSQDAFREMISTSPESVYGMDTGGMYE